MQNNIQWAILSYVSILFCSQLVNNMQPTETDIMIYVNIIMMLFLFKMKDFNRLANVPVRFLFPLPYKLTNKIVSLFTGTFYHILFYHYENKGTCHQPVSNFH